MMSDLFTQFDPSVNLIFTFSPTLFWALSLFVLFYFMPSTSFTFISSPKWSLLYRLYVRQVAGIKGLVSGALSAPSMLSSRIYFVCLFSWIALLNLFGLFPGTFSLTSHFLFSVSMGFPVWVGSVLYCFSQSASHISSHWVGTGVPSFLASSLALIEQLSLIIRSFALTVRLVANILAGHAITSIMANAFMYSMINPSIFALLVLAPSVVGFFYFEMGVSLVQAGVFSGLLTIYYGEASS